MLRKLRNRSAAELRIRGLQLGRTWLERLELSREVGEPSEATLWRRLSPTTRRDIAVGDAARLLADFRATSSSLFFPGFANRIATVRAIRTRWPNAIHEITTRADRIRAGSFDLLGYRGLSFGSPIDWHLDPIANRTAPAAHWSRIRYLDAGAIGDHKVIWELNRHQYFLTLGRAYWLTGDETYAEMIVAHLESWMNANPPKTGVNWASSLEVAYRAISWVWALQFLRESPALTPAVFRRVLAFLDLHAKHVAAYLSTYFSPNTHLTGEALGLFVIGSCFPQLAGADQWSDLGRSLLREQIGRQIRPDGVYVEQSPYYHRYTLEIYLAAIVIARRGRHALDGIEPVVQTALDHAMFLTMPDGTFPLVGDDDGGELFPLTDELANDFRPMLAVAAALFKREDYAAVAGGASEHTLWLAGVEGLDDFDRLPKSLPAETSRGFHDGGFYVMRDDWTSRSNFTLIDAGPHGFLACGHAHADALSFVLCVGGRQVLIDPGTLVYTASEIERDRFRSTPAHNAVSVDGLSSSEPGGGAFRWKHVANTTVRRWVATADVDYIEGRHDGFMRLASPVQAARSILYIKESYWVIRDALVGEVEHGATVHFHAAPGIEASVISDGCVRLVDRDSNVDVALHTFAPNGTFVVLPDWVSPQYGRKVAAPTCTFRTHTARGATEIVTFVLPAGEDSLRVERCSAGVFAVEGSHMHDTVCVGPTSAEGVESDAALTVVRREPAIGGISSFFLIDGRRLVVDGVEMVNLGERAECVDGMKSASSHVERKAR